MFVVLLYFSDTFGVCGVSEETPSQVPGWWGDKGVEIIDPKECKALDRRPGLTFIKYLHPANISQPDYVSFYIFISLHLHFMLILYFNLRISVV